MGQGFHGGWARVSLNGHGVPTGTPFSIADQLDVVAQIFRLLGHQHVKERPALAVAGEDAIRLQPFVVADEIGERDVRHLRTLEIADALLKSSHLRVGNHLIVSPNVASTDPQRWIKLRKVFTDNLGRYLKKEPLANLVDGQGAY